MPLSPHCSFPTSGPSDRRRRRFRRGAIARPRSNSPPTRAAAPQTSHSSCCLCDHALASKQVGSRTPELSSSHLRRSGRNRTCARRFTQPMLMPLSYRPYGGQNTLGSSPFTERDPQTVRRCGARRRPKAIQPNVDRPVLHALRNKKPRGLSASGACAPERKLPEGYRGGPVSVISFAAPPT